MKRLRPCDGKRGVSCFGIYGNRAFFMMHAVTPAAAYADMGGINIVNGGITCKEMAAARDLPLHPVFHTS